MRAELLAPAAMAGLHRAAKELLATRPAADGKARRTRIQALRDEIARLVDAVARVGLSEALRVRLAAAEGELAEVERQAAPSVPTVSAAQIVAAYRRRMLALRDALDGTDRERTRALLADMLGPVALVTDESGQWAEVEEPAQRVALAGSPSGMVAEARNVSRKRRIRIR